MPAPEVRNLVVDCAEVCRKPQCGTENIPVSPSQNQPCPSALLGQERERERERESIPDRPHSSIRLSRSRESVALTETHVSPAPMNSHPLTSTLATPAADRRPSVET